MCRVLSLSIKPLHVIRSYCRYTAMILYTMLYGLSAHSNIRSHFLTVGFCLARPEFPPCLYRARQAPRNVSHVLIYGLLLPRSCSRSVADIPPQSSAHIGQPPAVRTDKGFCRTVHQSTASELPTRLHPQSSGRSFTIGTNETQS